MNNEFFRERFDEVHDSRTQRSTTDRRPYVSAFSVLFNYWEVKPSLYEEKLHQLALQDVQVLTTFVPWAHVETDIYHSLIKFLRAAHGAKLHVKLLLMPELGIHYPNAGIPKEILVPAHNTASHLAADRQGNLISNVCAPNIFALPSFFSPEVLKRFGNYIIKVGSILNELSAEMRTLDFCEVVISNGLFSYFRSFGAPSIEHGDYSAAHVMAFRDFLDREYVGSTGEPFKRQVYESHNRHRFMSYVEGLLREKTEMILSKKSSSVRMTNIDVLNPECAPLVAEHSLLSEVFNFRPSVAVFFSEIQDASLRKEKIFFNGTGVFRKFTDQEKNFLILSSLIYCGKPFLGVEEVLGLTDSFKNKLTKLISVIDNGAYSTVKKVKFISASHFSPHAECLNFLKRQVPGVLSLSTGLSKSLEEKEQGIQESLVFVDPIYVLRHVDFLQVLTMAQGGKIVAIPAPMGKLANYSDEALTQFEKFKKGRQPLRINLGVSYEVYDYHLGKVIFYNAENFWFANQSNKPDLDLFFKALLGLAEVKPLCAVNDARVQVVGQVSLNDVNDRLLFFVNPTRDMIAVKISFEKPVALSGLPVSADSEQVIGKSFELEVPPLGFLSMSVNENLSQSVLREQGETVTWN